jgi:hypothetical protein
MGGLAQDDIVISIGAATVRCRPSLRAALRLERRFGGFRPLLEAIQGGSITAATSILTETGNHPAPADLITAPADEPLRDRLARIEPALTEIVLQLADVSPPADEIEQDAEASAPDQITMQAALIQIFGLATGVLGWSPAVAWEATPAEIWTAMDARLAMTRAAAGIPSPKRKGPDLGQLDSAGLADLAMMVA